jgi:hypothetical protein
MALIPISEWIDRFGTPDDAGEVIAMHASDHRVRCARHGAVSTGSASPGESLRALLQDAWAHRHVPRLTLRRG